MRRSARVTRATRRARRIASSNALPGSVQRLVSKGMSDNIRRSGRVAEGAPLLREYTLIAYRGFESLLLRHLIKSASLAEAFLIRALIKRDENRRFDQIRLKEYLAPSRVSGETRRVRTAPRLFWVIPPSPPPIKKGPSGPFFYNAQWSAGRRLSDPNKKRLAVARKC